jgi:DNA-binding response OmpR family regulator
MKVLLIEDEKDMQDNICASLAKEGFRVEVAGDFDTAIDKVLLHEYDCILLDIMLPNGSGLDVLKELKKQGKSESVIILSAKDSLDDKITGLDLGADDYLTKPFHMAELNARLKSVIRRRSFEGKNEIRLNNLTLFPDEHSVHIAGEQIELNRKEFDILYYFVANKNRLINRSAMAEHVWGDHMDEADNFDFIYSQIKNLRKKLRDSQAEIEIKSVYGIGYKLIV